MSLFTVKTNERSFNGATTFGIMPLSIMTFSISINEMRYSITTLSIMTFSISINEMRHSIISQPYFIQHNNKRNVVLIITTLSLMTFSKTKNEM